VAGAEKKIDLVDVEELGMPQVEPMGVLGSDMRMDWDIPGGVLGNDAFELKELAGVLKELRLKGWLPLTAWPPGYTGRIANWEPLGEFEYLAHSESDMLYSVSGHEPAPDSRTEADVITSINRLELDDGFCPSPPPGTTPEEDVTAAYGTLIMSDDTAGETTVVTAGTPVQAAGTTKLGEALLFGLSGGGLQYTDAVTRKFRLTCSAELAYFSGSIPMNAELIIRKNGADIVIDTPDVLLSKRAQLDNGVATSGSANTAQDIVAMDYIIELAQNDILTWWIDSSNDGDVVTLGDGATMVLTALN
jgi:hypothetical protein